MRRHASVAIAVVAAACAGHSSAPAPTAAPAGAAPSRMAAAPAGDPTSINYAAGTNRYRIDTEQHTAQEMMGNTTNIDITTMQVVSLNLAAAGDSFALRATLDSMSVTSSMPGADQAAADAARALVGKSVTGSMSRNGRVANVTTADTGVAVQQLVNGIREFFFVIPSLQLTPGREWTDTVSNAQNMGPMNMTTRSVRNHRVVGWEDRNGTRALHITTSSAYSVTGSGEAQGQPLEISGTGHVTMDRFISAAGVYLGATEADSADMNVNVVSMGMSIPVRRSQRATVTKLP